MRSSSPPEERPPRQPHVVSARRRPPYLRAARNRQRYRWNESRPRTRGSRRPRRGEGDVQGNRSGFDASATRRSPTAATAARVERAAARSTIGARQAEPAAARSHTWWGVELERTTRRRRGPARSTAGQSSTGGLGDDVSADATRARSTRGTRGPLATGRPTSARGEQVAKIGTDDRPRCPVYSSSVWTPLVHVLWKPDPRAETGAPASPAATVADVNQSSAWAAAKHDPSAARSRTTDDPTTPARRPRPTRDRDDMQRA